MTFRKKCCFGRWLTERYYNKLYPFEYILCTCDEEPLKKKKS